MKYVLWDWNGTLLDDTEAALDTLNEMLARRGRPAVAMNDYRDHFRFPVRPYYAEIGMEVTDENWDDIAREYHELYERKPKRLNVETIAALRRVREFGWGESIISALREDMLVEITERLGVRQYLDYTYGTDNLDGSSKLLRGRELLARIRPLAQPSECVLIGDSLHDKEVADALGVRCVLCAQGSHAAWRLQAVAPTGETLLEALEQCLMRSSNGA